MRANKPLLHGDITASIIESLFEVHKELGVGFREYIYTRALERLLIATGHNVEREVAVMGRPRPSLWQKSALLPRLLRTSVQATKPAVPVVAVAVPFQSTVQLPFPETGASVTSMSLLTVDRQPPQVSDREMCFGMRCGV
jgi:hypothetical protein